MSQRGKPTHRLRHSGEEEPLGSDLPISMAIGKRYEFLCLRHGESREELWEDGS